MFKDFRVNSCIRHSPVDVLGILLLLFTAFPYVQIIPSGSYTQPIALFLAALIFVLKTSSMRHVDFRDRAALLGLALTGFAIFLITCFPYDNQQEYKYLLNYISPFVITLASLKYLTRHPDFSKKILQASILIWLAVAIVQKFISPTFALGLVGQWGEHSVDILESGRGVLSLAPEPTHHAFHMLILAACLIQLDRSSFSRILVLLCIFDAIVLAASSSALLAMVLASLILLFFHQLKWLAIVIIFIMIGWFYTDAIETIFPDGSRLFMLISAVLAEPTAVLSVDYSVNMRLGGMIASIIASGSNLFFPHGMGVASWEASREDLLQRLPWLMDLSNVGPPSGIGVLLFQIGLLALPFLWQVFTRILSINVRWIEQIVLLAIPFVFLGQYYISAPSFSLLYACALLRSYLLRQQRRQIMSDLPVQVEKLSI